MLIQRAIAISVPFYLHLIFIIACETGYTKESLHGLRCTTNGNISVWQNNYSNCVHRCMMTGKCHFIHHDLATDQCEMGLDRCEYLQPAAGVMVNGFGPPRHVCLHWVSSQGSVELPIKIKPRECHAARIRIGDVVLIGAFYTKGQRRFYANREGVKIGPVLETDQDIEILTVDATCPLPWMSYTAGEPLPFGAVTGGRLADGSETYVVKVNHSDNECVVFGYYNTNSALAYYECYGVHTTTSMEIMVML